MKIGKTAAWVIGIIVVLAVIGAMSDDTTSNTERVTTGETTTAEAESETSSPAVEPAKEKITISNSVYKPSQYLNKVVGEATNNDSIKHTMTLKATFYDADGKILGTGVGALNEVAPGETKTFELMVTDDVAGYTEMKVQVDSLF